MPIQERQSCNQASRYTDLACDAGILSNRLLVRFNRFTSTCASILQLSEDGSPTHMTATTALVNEASCLPLSSCKSAPPTERGKCLSPSHQHMTFIFALFGFSFSHSGPGIAKNRYTGTVAHIRDLLPAPEFAGQSGLPFPVAVIFRLKTHQRPPLVTMMHQ